MSPRVLKILRAIGVTGALLAGLMLCGLSLWLLKGGRISETGYHVDGSMWIACGSVFDTSGWQYAVVTDYFALPLGILLASTGLIIYSRRKSASIPNSNID